MPSHASPKKSLRRDACRRQVRKNRLTFIKTSVKRMRLALEDATSSTENTVQLMHIAQSALAKAASKGVIHKKTAARKVGRLMKAAAKVLSAGTSAG